MARTRVAAGKLSAFGCAALGCTALGCTLLGCTGVDATHVLEPVPAEVAEPLPPAPPAPPTLPPPVTGDDCLVQGVWPAFGAREVSITAEPELYLREPLSLTALAERIRFQRLDDGSAVPFDLEAIDELSARIVPRTALSFWQSYSLSMETSQAGCSGASGVFSTLAPALVPSPLRAAAALKLARKGNIVYSTAPSFHGLQVHRLTGTELELLGELHWPQSSQGLALLGERGYVPAGAEGVVILDTSQAEAPRVLGVAGVPGVASDVAPFQSEGRELLAVAAGSAGIVVLDVTDPERSSVVSTLDPSGAGRNFVRDVDLEGNVLAVANGEDGLFTLDLSDPAQPLLLGQVAEPIAREVHLRGGVVYVLFDGWPRIRSFDATLPTAALGEWGTCGIPCGLFSASADLFDDELYVATSQGGVLRVAAGAQGSLLESNQPALRARSAVASVLASSDVTLIGEVGGPAVFAPDGSGPYAFAPDGHGDASDVVVRGRYAYVAASFAGLQTFDLADPLHPRNVGRVDSPGVTSAHDFASTNLGVHGDLLLLSDGRAGMSIYRLDDPAQPALAVTFTEGIDRLNSPLAWVGDRAYACNDNAGIELFDVSEPGSPRHEVALRFPSGEPHACRSLQAHPTEPLLYMSDLTTLAVYVVEPGGSLTLATAVTPPLRGSLGTIALAGERLFAATLARDFAPASLNGLSPRLQVFSLTDPRAPLPVWRSEPLPVALATLSVAGPKLFAGGGTRLSVFDVSGVEPELEGTVTTQSVIRQLLATADALYIAQSTGGLNVLRTGPLPVPDGAVAVPPRTVR